MSTASSLFPLTTQYAAEGRHLLSLHGTNGRAVKIEAVNGDGEIVDECDVKARSWVVCWTRTDGYYIEKSFDDHNRACVIAGVLQGTRC